MHFLMSLFARQRFFLAPTLWGAWMLTGCVIAPAPPMQAAGPEVVGIDENGNTYTYADSAYATSCCYTYYDYPPYYYYPAPFIGYGYYGGRGYYGQGFRGGGDFHASAGFHGGFGGHR